MAPTPGSLDTDPLRHAIWHALTTSHQELAQSRGQARRYPQSVAPFAAVASSSLEAFQDLAALLDPGDAVYLLDTPLEPGQGPATLQPDGLLPGLQMGFPHDAPLPPDPHGHTVEALSCRHRDEMLHLIQLAYPGFFRSDTCRMGPYFGIRDQAGELIAMGGTRFSLHPWYEISGLCSHPAHAGRGLATAVLVHLLRQHRRQGVRSFLHVGSQNGKAVALYTRLGFQTLRPVSLHRLLRVASAAEQQ